MHIIALAPVAFAFSLEMQLQAALKLQATSVLTWQIVGTYVLFISHGWLCGWLCGWPEI